VLVCSIAIAAALPRGNGLQPASGTFAALDLEQYAGTYYEIARLPNAVQKQCATDVTATYAVRTDGRVDVLNRCRKKDGTTVVTRGVARRAGGEASGARLEVRSGRAWLFVPRRWVEYWVLAVGRDYTYAVVGGPRRNHLRILSRLPQMPDLAYRQALEVAKSNGYDVSRLVKTPQEQK
jgi:apolipoprotein D and lipocalin family protein